MTVAEVMSDSDPTLELAPDQIGVFNGEPVTMLAVLDRTVVVEVNGERVLVRHADVDVPDPSVLQWQRRPSSRASHVQRRAAWNRTRR